MQYPYCEMTIGVSVGLRDDEIVPDGGAASETVSVAGKALTRMRADARHRISRIRYMVVNVVFRRGLCKSVWLSGCLAVCVWVVLNVWTSSLGSIEWLNVVSVVNGNSRPWLEVLPERCGVYINSYSLL